MADDKAVGSGFIFKHGEKIAAGVSGAALLGYALWACVIQGPDESIATASDAATTLEEKSDRYVKEKAVYDQAAAARNTEAEWKALDRAEPIKAWAGNFRPSFEFTEKSGDDPEAGPKTSWIVADVSLTHPGVDPTGVSMDVEVEKVEQITTGTHRKLEASVSGWELQRKSLSGKATDWVSLPKSAYKIGPETTGSTPKKVFRFKDSSIDPKTRYAYRLRAIGESTEKPPKTYEGKFCAEKEVRTLSDFRWEPRDFLKVPDGRIQVGVCIYKFDRSINKELLVRLLQFEGDTIGVLVDMEKIPPERISQHKAKDPKTLKPATDNDGKPLPPVDFDTKARITKVESVMKDISRRVCERKFNPDGTSECVDVKVKTQPYAGNHVIITDDEGVAQDYWQPDLPDLKDDVCKKHAQPPEEAPK